MSRTIPHLEKCGEHLRLIVNGKPFRGLGGEIHNSSSSSLSYMEEMVWPALRPLHMNMVVIPAYWELIEPEEGVFDYSLIDGLIGQARRENVKIAFLWFGLWKNGASTYVPSWVKHQQERFFRVKGAGNPLSMFGSPNHGSTSAMSDTVSPLCQEAWQADANAFRHLMRHIREIDSQEQTVILMQLENEMGVLGASRDFSPYAQEEFEKDVPEVVAKAYGVNGTWQEAFGSDADEMFMAYYYANAVEQIAKAGTEEYPIPMYVNAWLEQFPEMPGSYPSGGPVAKVMKLWKAVAPTVAFYAPDIYVDHFRDVCDEYAVDGNPLFIPEVRSTVDTAAFMFYAFGKHNAVGYSPFGIEDLMAKSVEAMSADELARLNLQGGLFGRPDPAAATRLSACYEMLGNMGSVIDEAHEQGRIHGFLEYNDQGTIIEAENYTLKVTYGSSLTMSIPMMGSGKRALAGGFIIEDGDDFIIAGQNLDITFYPKVGERCTVAVERKEEGKFVDGVWHRNRVLNGDEGVKCMIGDFPNVICIKMFKIKEI